MQLPPGLTLEDMRQRINSHLPEAVRVFEVARTTRGFNPRTACSAREYLYMVPFDALTYNCAVPLERRSRQIRSES